MDPIVLDFTSADETVLGDENVDNDSRRIDMRLVNDKSMRPTSKRMKVKVRRHKHKVSSGIKHSEPKPVSSAKQKRKIVQEWSDNDFVSQPSERPPVQTKTKIGSSSIKTSNYKRYCGKKILMRCSPANLSTFLSGLTDEQKKVVKRMGFEKVLFFNIHTIPTQFAYWLVMNYDPSTDMVNTGTQQFKVSAKLINQVLGIPKGEAKVHEKFRPNAKDEVVAEFRSQFDRNFAKKVFIKKFTKHLEGRKDTGRMFQLNFLVMLFTLLGESMKSNTVNQRFLPSVSKNRDVKSLNWCEYCMTCLRRSRTGWTGAEDEHFNGPLLLLSVLYAHSLRKKGDCAEGKSNLSLYNYGLFLEIENDLSSGTTQCKTTASTGVIKRVNKKLKMLKMAAEEQHEDQGEYSGDEGPCTQIQKLISIDTMAFDIPAGHMEDSVLMHDFDGSREDNLMDVEVEDESEVQLKQNTEEELPTNENIEKNDAGEEIQEGIDGVNGQTFGEGYHDMDLEDSHGDDLSSTVKLEMVKIENSFCIVNRLLEQSLKDITVSTVVEQVGVEWSAFLSSLIERSRRKEDTAENEQKTTSKEGLESTPFIINPSEMQEWDKLEKAATKEKSTKEYFPSFDLGITQLTPLDLNPEKEAMVGSAISDGDVSKERVVDVSKSGGSERTTKNATDDVKTPASDEKGSAAEKGDKDLVGECNLAKQREPRVKSLGDVLCSPYCQRQVRLSEKRTRAENSISNSVFSASGPEWDLLFTIPKVIDVPRVIMESLTPGICIHVVVVNAWSHVLNNEERRRSKGSVNRLFCTCPMINRPTYERDDKAIIDEFSRMMAELLEKENIVDIKAFDLVFVPIIQAQHYYLICFNLKKPGVLVIDNSATDQPFENKYMGWPERTLVGFAGYLKSIGHAKAKLMELSKPVRAEMKWRTLQNPTDCGVYMMRHMETYKGEDVKDWDCGLVEESAEGHKRQLVDLRRKYTAKILMHDINTSKDKVEEAVKMYLSIPLEDKKKLFVDVVDRILIRLRNEVD